MQARVRCSQCMTALRRGQTAFQRKGSQRLFCSTACLIACFGQPQAQPQPQPRLCACCHCEVWPGGGQAIVAQAPDGDTFLEFCSSGCLARHEENTMKENAVAGVTKPFVGCDMCGKQAQARHEIMLPSGSRHLCSDSCLRLYRGGLHPPESSVSTTTATTTTSTTTTSQHRRLPSILSKTTFKESRRSLPSTAAHRSPSPSPPRLPPTPPSPSSPCPSPIAIPPIAESHPSPNALPMLAPQQHLVTSTQHPVTISLKCAHCQSQFSARPRVLEWKGGMWQFCTAACLDEFKRVHGVTAPCHTCGQERTLHDTQTFSGVQRTFCSEGCRLVYKAAFARRLGLRCVTCAYCGQTCRRAGIRSLPSLPPNSQASGAQPLSTEPPCSTESGDSSASTQSAAGSQQQEFCSLACLQAHQAWENQQARCAGCGKQGKLAESVTWRGEKRGFCDQRCLLFFYSVQAQPDLSAYVNGDAYIQPRSTNVQTNHRASTNRPPQKNKAVLCRPLCDEKQTQTVLVNSGTQVIRPPSLLPNRVGFVQPSQKNKAVLCRPLCIEKQTQTDGPNIIPIPIPIPVPIYIPVPLQLYSQISPVTLPVPIPLPIPVVLPMPLDMSDRVLTSLTDLSPPPSPPALADLIAMGHDERVNEESFTENEESLACTENEGRLSFERQNTTSEYCGLPMSRQKKRIRWEGIRGRSESGWYREGGKRIEGDKNVGRWEESGFRLRCVEPRSKLQCGNKHRESDERWRSWRDLTKESDARWRRWRENVARLTVADGAVMGMCMLDGGEPKKGVVRWQKEILGRKSEEKYNRSCVSQEKEDEDKYVVKGKSFQESEIHILEDSEKEEEIGYNRGGGSMLSQGKGKAHTIIAMCENKERRGMKRKVGIQGEEDGGRQEKEIRYVKDD